MAPGQAPRVRALALAGFLGAAGFLVAVAVADITQPGLDPVRDTVSDLATGPHGTVLTVAFWVHGASVVALAAGLALAGPAVQGPARRGSVVALAASGAATFLLGFFPTDGPGDPATATGAVHDVLATVSFTALLAGFFLHDGALGRDPRWVSLRPTLRALAAASLVLLLAFGAQLVLDQRAGVGLVERALVTVNMAWLILASLRLRATVSPA